MIVRKARNGKYWQLYWHVDGRKVVESIGKLTERDAERARQEKAIELDKNPALAAGTGEITIAGWIDRYVANRRGDISDGTVEDVLTTKKVLMKHFDAEQLIGKVGKSEALKFYTWLKERKKRDGVTPIAVDTVRKHIRNCKTLWAYALEVPDVTGVKLNPFKQKGIKSGVSQKHKGEAEVPADDLKRILEACPSAAWRLMFALPAFAALRSNEARSLRWTAIDWNTHRIFIAPPTDEHGRIVEDTTKRRAREVPIEPELYAMLREAFEASVHEGPCDGLPDDAQELAKGARRIVESAGVANYGPPLHTLRGACVSRWVDRFPAPKVAYWAGHSVKVMQEHYVRPSEEDFARLAGTDKARRIAELKAELAALQGDEQPVEVEEAEEVPF